ncbi:MAG: hypothetical protein A3G76_11675 [Acidobacteria bacterium RIFCSPLOWO2_12_FULL_65_11]|nr:MAG: hypothetical protein A3H95_11815 [Acidobacteria bacterium RIFCSPLOWO2_02_FULL_64_15]OFW32930.1 MAG: hypothetical protein A3G76_11675 [Acidobacteria bacterium RIFCSPLOWO2_12_FULL_65_11]
MELSETAAVVLKSVVALESLAVPSRLRFGANDGIPHIVGTGFVVDSRGLVMTAGSSVSRLVGVNSICIRFAVS